MGHKMAYTDDRHRATSAYIFLGTNLLTWTAKKQSAVYCSTADAEYRVLALTATDIRWYCYWVKELIIPLPSIPLLYCENVYEIHMVSNPILHARARHIKIAYHFLCELVRKSLAFRYVPSYDQIAMCLLNLSLAIGFLIKASTLN